MGLFDNLFGPNAPSTPLPLGVDAPKIDTSQAAIDQALKDASTVPDVAKDTAQAGIVDEGGKIGVDVTVDKSLGKDGKFGDVIGEAEDGQAGWKFGAWWKKSWGKK